MTRTVLVRLRGGVLAIAAAVLAACGGGSGGGAADSAAAGLSRESAQATGSAALVTRHVRLEALSEVNGNPWAAVAEFNLLGADGTPLPRAGWRVSADSEERVGENAPATNAIDGDPYTFWHTRWQGANPPMPHQLSIDLGSATGVSGFRYLPRQGGVNGRLRAWRFLSSADGLSWTLVTEGTFAVGDREIEVSLPAATGANQVPTIARPADRSDVAGSALSLALSAADADGDALTYAATGLPAGLSIASATGRITGTPTTPGVSTVTVSVSDGKGGSASASFAWTITAAPTGGGTAAVRHVRLEAVSEINRNPWSAVAEFNLVDTSGATLPRAGWRVTTDSQETVGENAPATNAIDGDPYTFWHTQWQGANPPPPHHLSIDLGSARTLGAFRYLPRQGGQNGRIRGWRFLTSPDGVTWSLLTQGEFANVDTEITVALPAVPGTPAPVNQAPTIVRPADRSDVAGNAVTLALSASDADGDALSFTASGLPAGLSINATNGRITGTPTTVGSSTVSVSVSDGKGGSASTSFAWAIAAPGGSSSPVSARWVRLEALSEVNGGPWASMAEFNLVAPGGALVSRSGWRVTTDSQETVGENAPATNAIDGDPNTFWHTQWQGASPAMPHHFTVDLGGERQIAGFRYLPRAAGTNGTIRSWRFHVSADGRAWQLVSQGSFTGTPGITESIVIPPGSVTNRPPALAVLPTTREDAVGAPLQLQLAGSDADGDVLTYAAQDLPQGLSLDSRSGLISGTPARTETRFVNVSVSDARGGVSSQTFNWVVVAPGGGTGAGGDRPVVFHASAGAGAGRVAGLQGANFGSAPQVYFDGYPAAPLEIVNRVGTSWLAVRIPANAQGALVLRVANGTQVSDPVALNAARPFHLDATRLVPGGAFRVFGRQLMQPGFTPSLRVDGLDAAIDLAASDEHQLVARVPAQALATSAAQVVVDNGNGTGPAVLDRAVSIVTGASGDPFGLGVGWGAAFTELAGRRIDPTRDAAISPPALCDGVVDDAAPLQQAIDRAAAGGGGVVQLPAGVCRIGSTLTLRSGVVLQGAGKTLTELRHTALGYPVFGQQVDRVGLAAMTVTSTLTAADGLVLKDSSRLFFKQLRIRLGRAFQMFLTDNVDFVVADSDFEQAGNSRLQGPYTMSNSRGLVFERNTTTWVTGSPSFYLVHDSVVRASRFTRDATDPATPGAVHSMVLDFAHRASVIGNTLDLIGGPIQRRDRNDGEAILSEGGGGTRTETLGNVASATATTLTDPSNTVPPDPLGQGRFVENYGVAIVAGRGMGQMRRVVSYSAQTHTMVLDRAWDVLPDTSSRYATFVFGLEKVLIKGNVLSQNPRGIWLYGTAMRDVEVAGNTMTEGGGIYLRSYQNLSQRWFNPIYGVLVRGNRISNTTGRWTSHINAMVINGDGSAFGTGFIGLELRDNELTANRPNLSVPVTEEEYANTEGLSVRLTLEGPTPYQGTAWPQLLGTIVEGNACSHCDVALRIGTGAVGTTILGTRLLGGGVPLTDTSVLPSGERSLSTVAP